MISITQILEEGHVLQDHQLIPDYASAILFQQQCERLTEEVINKSGAEPTPPQRDIIVYKAQNPTIEANGSFQGMPVPVPA